MLDLQRLGKDWLVDQVDGWTEEVEHLLPSEFVEKTRYLPKSVTNRPGYLSFSVNPYMREVVDCCSPDSDVREVNMLKGVQITYTTMTESVLLYYMAKIKTQPCMFITSDRDLAKARVENYILPMLKQSGLSHIIRSSDEGNSRKTGKTANHLQWEGDGFLVPFGANNAGKMRSFSIQLMLKDELDEWPLTVGTKDIKQGDPDKLTDDRCAGYYATRKIYRGSTPLIEGTSKIYTAYLQGDQREYRVKCKHCGYHHALRWHTVDEETGVIGGLLWDYDDDGVLISESVRYACPKCGGVHYEYDKATLFSPEHGACWVPTAKPQKAGVRSYHLPALYSPLGFKPWSGCVADYLEGWDPINERVRDIGAYQRFYNNVLAMPFKVQGARIEYEQVSSHRRTVYRYGEIPNEYAAKYSGSKILFLTCTVDVHKSNLRVAVHGWCRDARPYLIDYFRWEDDDCTDGNSIVWQQLRDLIDAKVYEADDGTRYNIALTFVDAGYSNDTVVTFCGGFSVGVYPILGRDRPAKNQTIKEFAEFTTTAGTIGYRILVDHYKDRMGPVMRRVWDEAQGRQPEYHFNAPVDATDDQIKELTAEVRRAKKDEAGRTTYQWHRPGNKPNELWDLTGYAYAAVEVLAWSICIQQFELETIDWPQFWDYATMPENNDIFVRA